MAETETRGTHVVVMAAVIYIRCACGWEHRAEELVGKSDEDLIFEVIARFEIHRKSKTR